MYMDSRTEILYVMTKTDSMSIPKEDIDVSIFKQNFKEAIQEKDGKLTSQILWFWKGDTVKSVWEWFNWYFSKAKKLDKK